jgi:hypothetical protein
VFRTAEVIRKERAIGFVIDGGEADPAETHYNEEGWNHRIKLVCDHNKDRKVYYARVIKSLVNDRGTYTVEQTSPFEDVALVGSEPCARFSQKGLEDFASRVVAYVDSLELGDDSSKLATLVRMARDFASARS